jgi:hypothetical protein
MVFTQASNVSMQIAKKCAMGNVVAGPVNAVKENRSKVVHPGCTAYVYNNSPRVICCIAFQKTRFVDANSDDSPSAASQG